MQELISSLLDYSRIGTDEKEFKLISSKDVLDDAITNLKSSLEECSGAIDYHAEDFPEVYGDSVQLLQLFQNVIGNAIRYHKKGEPPKIKITCVEREEDVLFSVADNGLGIEEEYLEKIFGVFQRLHARDEYPGTGIGLAICDRVVHRHGGTIWAESELGKGSTFYFSISKSKYTQ